MTDHVSDEGRHANYFAKLMKAHWARLPEERKQIIGSMLPAYLDDYLAADEDRAFDRKILRASGFSAAQVTGNMQRGRQQDSRQPLLRRRPRAALYPRLIASARRA
jgi:hypothetical protein